MASSQHGESTNSNERKKKQDLLKTYYKVEEDSSGQGGQQSQPEPDTMPARQAARSPQLSSRRMQAGRNHPDNIDGSTFNPDVYLEKMLREKSLGELISEEHEVVRDIKRLDNEMQTLVYENYNKFIVATNTIHQMKNDFKKMEEDMSSLSDMMGVMTTCSAGINDKLEGRRKNINKLASVHSLLMKLQFLFELPSRLKQCIDAEAYGQAVRYYVKTHKALERYKDMPSFHGIHMDCGLIIDDLKAKLKERFNDNKSTAKQLAEYVDLLYQLNEPTEQLCNDFLSHARVKLDERLKELKLQNDVLSNPSHQPASVIDRQDVESETVAAMDMLEFMDHGCNGFLSDLAVVVATYNDMFLRLPSHQGGEEENNTVAQRQLVKFVTDLMEKYLQYTESRIKVEARTGDNAIYIRALDRFHRRLQAMNQLLPDSDFARIGTDMIAAAARARTAYYLDCLKVHFMDCVTDIRQSIVAPRSQTAQSNDGIVCNLAEILNVANTSVVNELKAAMNNLHTFIETDISFGMKAYFRDTFCKVDVREGLVVSFFKHIFSQCLEYCEMNERNAFPAEPLLVLSHMCLDMNRSSISYSLATCEDLFQIEEQAGLTTSSSLCAKALEMGRKLLEQYVHIQGSSLSQMLRKSVETRDWLNTIEPRNVRPVMKRVIEDLTSMDQQVSQLYEEVSSKERSSDSSKRTFSHHSLNRVTGRSTWHGITAPGSTMGNSLMSNIHKIFADRIEIFSSIDFNKSSVLMGIIKIALKTLLESVRLRTFGKYGLQQIQVDIHYLNQYLWRFAEDENLVYTLLDEILSSAVHRCCEPELMEQSVIDVICDKLDSGHSHLDII